MIRNHHLFAIALTTLLACDTDPNSSGSQLEPKDGEFLVENATKASLGCLSENQDLAECTSELQDLEAAVREVSEGSEDSDVRFRDSFYMYCGYDYTLGKDRFISCSGDICVGDVKPQQMLVGPDAVGSGSCICWSFNNDNFMLESYDYC